MQAIEAFAMLAAEHSTATFVVRGGRETHGNAVFARARELGLDVRDIALVSREPKDVIAAIASAPGAVLNVQSFVPEDALLALYRIADGVLANSGREPFGLVGLEVMAAAASPSPAQPARITCSPSTTRSSAIPAIPASSPHISAELTANPSSRTRFATAAEPRPSATPGRESRSPRAKAFARLAGRPTGCHPERRAPERAQRVEGRGVKGPRGVTLSLTEGPGVILNLTCKGTRIERRGVILSLVEGSEG